MISLEQVRRRKVVQWALAYLAGAWALLQGLDLVAGSFGWPGLVTRLAIVLAAVGLLVVLVVSWYHGERGAQRASGVEILMLTGIFLLAGAALSWVAGIRVRTAAPAAGAVAPRPAPATLGNSVAVLPFLDLSPGKDQEYFSDGITEEILNALAQVDGLRVAARTSAFQFKGRNVDLREVGRMLAVRHVLEGSVQRIGNRIRITAQLIDAGNGYHLWSNRYDREAADVFAIEDEISHAIAAQLRLQLAQGEVLARSPTSSLAAHDLYLQASYVAGGRTAAALAMAERFYSDAIHVDSSYALAYVGLADTYMLQEQYARGLSTATYRARAQAAAARAFALDSTSSEVHATLGMLALHDFHAARAERFLKRAIELNPGYPTAHHWYAIVLRSVGRAAEAKSEIEIARKLDPLSRVISTVYATCWYLAGDYQGAIDHLKQTLRLDPAFPEAHRYLARSYAMLGRYDLALGELDMAARSSGLNEEGDRAWVLGRSGDTAQARRLLRQLLARRERQYTPALWIALAYTGLGQQQEALDWLDRACDEGDAVMRDVPEDPRFAELRSLPRFRRIAQRILGPPDRAT